MGISDWIRVGVAGCLGLFLAGCGEKHYQSNHRVEIVISTPTGDITGSTVYRVDVRVGQGILVSGGTFRSRGFHGEAIALKLPDGKYLFVPFVENQAILSDALFSADIEKIKMPPDLSPYESMSEYERILASIRERRRIPLDLYPPMLTFRNLNDPHSAMLVTRENFAEIFGPGMQIKAMYLTQLDPDVPVSKTGVRTLLPWLKSFGQQPGAIIRFRQPNPADENRGDILISSDFFDTDIFK
nr:hypothetical protein [uncultured Gellertiella sp.]